MLRIIILTQDDYFFIPTNIQKIINNFNVLEICIIKSKGSLENKIKEFIKWFGLVSVFKLGIWLLTKKIQSYIDGFCSYKLWGGLSSIKSVSQKEKIPYKSFNTLNTNKIYNHFKNLNPDIIISYSCPIVIKEPLLSLPPRGVINVHGSYLPHYRGLLPSFWHLFNEEKFAGASVHYMNQNIDDGDIIIQEKVDISECKSMFCVMKKTKLIGGELMLKALFLMANGKSSHINNTLDNGSYYSWPSIKEAKEFKRKGYKLI